MYLDNEFLAAIFSVIIYSTLLKTSSDYLWNSKCKELHSNSNNQYGNIQSQHNDIADIFLIINCNVHQYCTRQSNELHLPLAKTNSMKRTFQYMGSADFNSLPTLAQRTTNRKSLLAQVNSLF